MSRGLSGCGEDEVDWGWTVKRLFCCHGKEKLSFEPNLLMAVQQELDPEYCAGYSSSRRLCSIMHKTQVITRQLVDIKLFIVQLCEIMMVHIQEFGFLKTET